MPMMSATSSMARSETKKNADVWLVKRDARGYTAAAPSGPRATGDGKALSHWPSIVGFRADLPLRRAPK